MLREAKNLHGATLHALDGEIGRVDEILFDDQHWAVRYLIVDTGNWLSGRKVLISPMAFGKWDWEKNTLSVQLTRQQIENSPGVETDEPVSRQWEKDYYGYYAWPYYWGGMGGWGAYWYPQELLMQPVGVGEAAMNGAREMVQDRADAHLRSTKAVSGYGIAASDGHLGHVADFIVDDETWRICYLAVDTRDWWPGKKVLLPPSSIGHMNWPERTVTVNVTREQVQNAPEWDSTQPISHTFEDQLYGYYARQRPSSPAQPRPDMLEQLGYGTHQGERMRSLEQPIAPEQSAIVAIYETHGEAETAIRELQKLGFDMTKLSIVGKDYHTDEDVVGYYTTGDRMRSWGMTGAFWGGIWSVLFGSAFFFVPGLGPILAAGPVVAWIVAALESAVVVGGLSALGAALFSIGIPKDSIIAYETQIKAGKFVVIAHDVPSKLDAAVRALKATHPSGIVEHAPQATVAT